MIQLRKKDYLQRIIEEFFSKIQEMISGGSLNKEEQMNQLQKCFELFRSDFDVTTSDSTKQLVEKINDIELLEQYAKVLVLKFELLDIKSKDDLDTALDIINFIDITDKTFSWNRSVLKQDILRLLSTY